VIRLIGEFIRETFRRNRLLAATATLHLALFVLLAPLTLFDSMQILGINRWIKPMKFAISIAIFLGTMAWLLSWLRESSPRAVRMLSAIMAGTMVGEMVVIVTQSARGVPSHFNNRTNFDGIMFSIMGVLIVINTLAAAYALYLYYRRPVTVSGAHLTGIRLGMLIFVLASLEGGLMVQRNAHTVGLHDGGPGLPFVNWSTGAGDLRVAHFVGMHALQMLPLLGWLLSRRAAPNGVRWVRIVAVLWIVVTGLLVAQALAGRPLLALMR
jgi:hypothetical protein